MGKGGKGSTQEGGERTEETAEDGRKTRDLGIHEPFAGENARAVMGGPSPPPPYLPVCWDDVGEGQHGGPLRRRETAVNTCLDFSAESLRALPRLSPRIALPLLLWEFGIEGSSGEE